jgi:hypothetical protein
MAQSFQLVIVRSYDLFALFSAIEQEGCVVGHQNDYGNGMAELGLNLLNEAGVSLVKAEVDCRKRFILWREIASAGEFALCVRVRKLH